MVLFLVSELHEVRKQKRALLACPIIAAFAGAISG